MGLCYSLIPRSEEAKAVSPSPVRLDFPVPQRCFSVGGPSSPPEDIKYVLPESVVLTSREAVVPTPVAAPAPMLPPRLEAIQEEEQENELSRFARGVYNDDFVIGPIPDDIEYDSEEMLEYDPVAASEDAEMVGTDSEGSDPEGEMPLDEDFVPEPDPGEEVVPEYNPYTDPEDVSEHESEDERTPEVTPEHDLMAELENHPLIRMIEDEENPEGDVPEDSNEYDPSEDLSEESDPSEACSDEEDPEMDQVDGQGMEPDAEVVPVPESAPLHGYPLRTDADWEALYTEYGSGRSDPTLIYEEYPPTPPRRRRRSVAELDDVLRQSEEISFMERQHQIDMELGRAQRELGIGGPLMDDPFFAEAHVDPVSPEPFVPKPSEPGPSRVRGPSSELDGEPIPKKLCLKSSTFRKRFKKP